MNFERAETERIRFVRIKSGGYRLLERCIVHTGIVGFAATIRDRAGRILAHHAQDGWMVAGEGYEWDGSSGPVIDRPANMRAGLFHDVCYQLLRMRAWPAELRAKADALYVRLYRLDASRIRARDTQAAEPRRAKLHWSYRWAVRGLSRVGNGLSAALTEVAALADHAGLRGFAGYAARPRREVEEVEMVAP